jgi:very-short-patch-repair endonuclease
VVVPAHARATAPAWIDVRWRLGLPTINAQPLKILRAPHAVVDAWHRARGAEARDLVYTALWERWVGAADVLSAIDDFPRVRDRRGLTRMLTLALGGAGSPTEVLARTHVFVGAAFVEWEWQAEIVVARRRRCVDMLHRRARLAVEFDGAAYHANDEAWSRDRERDTELAAAGYLTLRLTYANLRDRPHWCRRQVLAALATRLPSDGL